MADDAGLLSWCSAALVRDSPRKFSQRLLLVADVGELSLIFLKPLIYGLYLRGDALTGIDHG